MKTVFLILLAFYCIGADAQTRFVTLFGAGNGSGANWNNAINGIAFRAALQSATHGTVFWVSSGTYKPDVSVRDSDFIVPSGVKIYGGFSGNETLLTQRDSTNTTNRTIFSGEVQNDANIYNNTYNVVWLLNADATTELNSITITKGCADGGITYSTSIAQTAGAGLESINSYARIANVVFDGNITTGGGGGGACFANGSPRLINCTFINNKASGGGGFYCSSDSFYPGYSTDNMSVTVDHCIFKGNGVSFGGGAASVSNAHAIFTNCTFDNDSTFDVNFNGFGAGIYCEYTDTLLLRNCTFKNMHDVNANNIGGALYNNAQVCLVENCLFENNSSRAGAAINSNGSTLAITNSTFVKNRAVGLSADASIIINQYGGTVTLANCILDSVNSSIPQFSTFQAGANSITITRSLLVGSLPSVVVNGGNNLQHANPAFVNPNGGDYALTACSPAINAGSNALMLANAATSDLAGHARIFAGGTVDMGAYEYQWPSGPVSASYTATTNVALHTVTVTFTGVSPAPIDSLIWVWGDGQKQTVTTGFTAPLSHVYAANGDYNICVTGYSGICAASQYCKHTPLAIGDVSMSDRVKVYPNPVVENLTVTGAAGSSITLTNTVGQRLMKVYIGSAAQIIPLTHLPGGVYILTIEAQDGSSVTKKITKQS